MTNRVDTITGSIGASLATPSDGGSNWVQSIGSWSLDGSTGTSVASNSVANANAVLESSTTDVEVVTSMQVGAGAKGPLVRQVDSTNFYYGNVRSDNTPRIVKIVGGTATVISSESTGNTSAGTHDVKLRVTGTNPVLLTLYVDGVQKATASDSTELFAGTKHGMYASSNTLLFYSFSSTDIVGASTDHYVRSSDGSDADNGSTWALANATLSGAMTDSSAGDRTFVSDAHAESSASSQTITCPGTPTTPSQILGGDDAAEPPTALATTAVAATTTNNNITVRGSFYMYGLTLRAGSGSNNTTLFLNDNGNNVQVFENCVLENGATGSSGVVQFGSLAGSHGYQRLINTNLKFGGVAQGANVIGIRLDIEGGALASGSAAINSSLFRLGSSGFPAKLTVSGFDMSGADAACAIFSKNSGSGNTAVIRNSKLPTSWAGSLVTGTLQVDDRFEMHNCDAGDTNYRMWVEEYAGNIKSEIIIVRTGGASDGTTPLSWKMVSGTNAEYPTIALVSPEIVQWNATTGGSKTVTVEIVHDSQGAGTGADFQNNEIWLEVQYLGTSGFPLGAFSRSVKADVLATAADHTNSSETWTTTGLTTPVKQALSVTFTPQEKGFFHARVFLAKASKTVYVDPKITVS
jgi:hypothetical protein